VQLPLGGVEIWIVHLALVCILSLTAARLSIGASEVREPAPLQGLHQVQRRVGSDSVTWDDKTATGRPPSLTARRQVTPGEDRASDLGRLVYVVGCGRSGTTILGFCLGNAAGAIDLGEVLDFARFRGQPNGFEPGTENYQFWQRVGAQLHGDRRWPGFDAFGALQKRFDRHASLLPVALLGRLLVPFGLTRYRQALAALYESIFQEAGNRTCIDSSKYPSRLLHLAAILPPERLAIVHLIRDPAALVEAFSRDDQGPPRAAAPALLYYAFVNSAARCLIARHRAIPSTKLHYEAFVAEPEALLRAVGRRIGLDVEAAISKIASATPLRRGYIFNGNRMRIQPEVVLRRAPPDSRQPPSGNWLVRAARLAFLR